MYKILLVDDYQIFRKSIMRMPCIKSSRDFTVAYEASNGREALEILDKEQVDVIFTDIKMPMLDGIGLLKEVKRKKYSCPVVLISEYTEFEYAREGLVLGAFDYIIKPATPEKIEEVLSRIAVMLSDISRPSFLSLEVNELVHCLETPPANYEPALQAFIQKSIDISDHDILQLSITLFENLENIYSELEHHFKWIGNLLPDLDSFKNSIRALSSIEALDFHFSKFIKKIHEIIMYYGRQYTSDTINSIRDHILDYPYEKISLSDLSEHFFINKTYLSHAFKQETGISLVDFITHYKMDIASLKLVESQEPISEIAFLLGYEDSKYFSRIFKNVYCASPAEFRKKGCYDYT